MTKTCRERFENFCGSPKNPKFNLGGVWLGIGRSLEEEFRSWHDLCTLACGGQQLRCTLCCSPLHMGSQHAGHSTASANRAARWLTSFRATMLPILCRSCCCMLAHNVAATVAAAARWAAHGAAAAVAAARWHTTLGLPKVCCCCTLGCQWGCCCLLAHNVGAAAVAAAARWAAHWAAAAVAAPACWQLLHAGTQRWGCCSCCCCTLGCPLGCCRSCCHRMLAAAARWHTTLVLPIGLLLHARCAAHGAAARRLVSPWAAAWTRQQSGWAEGAWATRGLQRRGTHG